LAGSGSITANGGNGQAGGEGGGGGGGGRVAISATTNTYTGTTTATAGTGYQSGIDGTIYFGTPTFSNVTVTANTNASATISSVKTIAFWVKPTAATSKMVQLASGVNISSTDGVLSSNGITNPTYYVNSIQGGTTITANQWNHVVVTTSSGITANSILLGQMTGGYLAGQLDDVRLYTSEYSSGQVSILYSDSNTIAKLTLSSASEQAGPAPLVYWKFDEGTGTTTSDSSGNNVTATLAGNTIPTWQTENNCTSGKCLYLDGSSSKLTVSAISVSNIKSVGIWVKPTSVTSLALIDLDGGTHKITVSSGVISATGFNSPTIYVNGKVTTTLAASVWSYVEITTATGFTPNTALTLGNSASTYLTGYLDEVKLYDYTRSANQVLTDYAGKKAPIGASMIITPASYSSGQAPIGHWRLDENTGTSANDSSTSGATGTISGANWKPGKYGASLNFDGTDDVVTVATALTGVKTVEFWVNPNTTTQYMIDLDGGTHYISASSGTVSATGFAGTVTIYVNGVVSGTITANSWNHIAVTNTTSFNSTSSMTFGKAVSGGNQFLTGKLDDIRIYNYVRTQKQVISDMMGDGARSPVMAGSSSGGSGRAGGAVGYWKFDEGYGTTAHNSGSQGETLQGTLTNMATAPSTSTSGWTQSGKFGRALNFDQYDDSVILPASSALNFGTSSVTWSTWAKVYSYASGAPEMFDVVTHNGNYINTLLNNNRTVSCRTSDTNGPVITSTNTLTVNTWYHIACVRDASTSGLYLYVNGILWASQTSITFSSINFSGTQFKIGNHASGGIGTTPFAMDEVKIYPYALTADEVKLDYNKGSAQVLGALSDTNSLNTSQPNSAASEYCVPGDTTSTSCAAPVGRWDFEENTGSTVNDKSGNGNTGTWNGTLGNQWKPGKIGGSGNFNGSDNYVSAADSNSLDLTSAMTLEAWTYPTSFPGDYTQILIKNNANADFYGIGLNPTTGTVFCQLSGGTPNTINSTTATTLNNWNHIACSYDGSNIRIYINGKLDVTTARTGNTTASAALFNIGRDSVNGRYFPGMIDQVRVFNYARSAGQIAWDYNRGAPVGHWKMDECQGDTVHDSSGNANHGTINLSTTGTQTTALGMGTCTTNASTPWYNGATGKFNYSLNFDGTDDYVDLGNPSSLSLTGAMTISAWVKNSTSGHQSPEYRGVVTKGGISTSNTAFDFGVRLNANPTHTLYFLWYNGVTINGAEWQNISNLTDQAWHHIVGVRNSSNQIIFYVDGSQAGGATLVYGTGAPVDGGQNVLVGKETSSSNSQGPFPGQIDDVRIYNYALTGTQVKLLYNQNSGIRYGPSTGAP